MGQKTYQKGGLIRIPKMGQKGQVKKRVKDIWIRELSNFKGISLT